MTKKPNILIRAFYFTILIVVTLFVGLSILNWFFGYHGYEKEKYRRNSWRNKTEAIDRNTFVRDLETESNLKLDSFKIYIEKGYKYGYFSGSQTNFNLGDTKYPFQISQMERTDNLVYQIVNPNKGDSIGEHSEVYLNQPHIHDTLKMIVEKYRTVEENGISKAVWDSIGYVKIYEKR